MDHFKEMLSYSVSKKSFKKTTNKITHQNPKKHSDLESGTLL